MNGPLHYDHLLLPEKASEILKGDVWMGSGVNFEIFSSILEPVKFTAGANVLVTRGECDVEINLIRYHVKAPALVIIKPEQILVSKSATPDFSASFMVLSKNIFETLYMYISATPLYSVISQNPVMEIPDEDLEAYLAFYSTLESLVKRKENPYLTNMLLHSILAFFFSHGYKSFNQRLSASPTSASRLTEKFFRLVQENFKKERFLDFYADKLGITTKHLSRTVKTQTGYTAVGWIERYVVLEAKVLLKSSNLNISQIADELNFKSQSFFGKYFKKCTGMSPKQYRNS